jgi:hypothetical protein
VVSTILEEVNVNDYQVNVNDYQVNVNDYQVNVNDYQVNVNDYQVIVGIAILTSPEAAARCRIAMSTTTDNS